MPITRLRPEQVREMHLSRTQWLTDQLAEPFVGPTVVITHPRGYLPLEPHASFDRVSAVELGQT